MIALGGGLPPSGDFRGPGPSHLGSARLCPSWWMKGMMQRHWLNCHLTFHWWQLVTWTRLDAKQPGKYSPRLASDASPSVMVLYCRHRSYPPVSPKVKVKGCRSHIRLFGDMGPSPGGLHHRHSGRFQSMPLERSSATLPRVTFSLCPGSPACVSGLCNVLCHSIFLFGLLHEDTIDVHSRVSPPLHFSGPDVSGGLFFLLGEL